jgi:hypothetical protein
MNAVDIPQMPDNYALPRADHQIQEVRALSDVIPECTKEFELRTSVFFLEKGVFLRLRKHLILKKVGRSAFIEEWGFSIAEADLLDIEQKVPRYFLDMFSKAKNNQLTEQEHEKWINIIESIDYEALSVEFSRPYYLEGEIKQIHANKGILVAWQDETTEWLDSLLLSNFRLFDNGDKFSAYIKRDRFNKVVSVENILSRNHESGTLSYDDLPVLEK